MFAQPSVMVHVSNHWSQDAEAIWVLGSCWSLLKCTLDNHNPRKPMSSFGPQASRLTSPLPLNSISNLALQCWSHRHWHSVLTSLSILISQDQMSLIASNKWTLLVFVFFAHGSFGHGWPLISNTWAKATDRIRCLGPWGFLVWWPLYYSLSFAFWYSSQVCLMQLPVNEAWRWKSKQSGTQTHHSTTFNPHKRNRPVF